MSHSPTTGSSTTEHHSEARQNGRLFRRTRLRRRAFGSGVYAEHEVYPLDGGLYLELVDCAGDDLGVVLERSQALALAHEIIQSAVRVANGDRSKRKRAKAGRS
jgi:hypothetical protein